MVPESTFPQLLARLRAGEPVADLGAPVRALAATLPGRAQDLALVLADRLVGGLDPYVPPDAAVAVLAEVFLELARVAEGDPVDDDAVDVHRSAVRSLAPLDLGFDPAAEPAPPAQGAADPEPAPPHADRPTADVVAVFQHEARELLTGCESSLLALEADRGDAEAVRTIFRALHSFKGNCGFMGYRQLEQLAHRAETLLVLLKEGRRPIDDAAISALIYVVDALTGALQDGGDDPSVAGLAELVAELDRLAGPDADGGPSAADAPEPAPPATTPPAPEVAAVRSEAAGPRVETTLRVDVAKVEALLDLMGELIIAQTAVRHLQVSGPEAEAFGRASAQLDRVVRGLQDVSLSLRMVPVGPTFKKMVRVCRDVSQRVGKVVELVLDGEETEIDKSVAELIADPLVHLVRNAIDHGLEAPEARAAAGKPRAGRLRLSGAQVGGEVWIRVEDDGRGLDRGRILARAIERGLCTAADGAGMSDAEVFAFVFEPGFSTAAAVTDVSGRGVGMDVVARNLEQVKGRVDIRSVPGQGATFTLRIPLTLAIIEGMLVRVGTESFTVPLLNIRESVVCRDRDLTVLSSGQEMVRIRGELIPVLRVHQLFDLHSDHTRLPDGILLVVEDGGHPVCLFVDQLVGQRQTVIKAVSGYLGQIDGIAGCTVLGDGRISLVLDVGALVQRTGVAA